MAGRKLQDDDRDADTLLSSAVHERLVRIDDVDAVRSVVTRHVAIVALLLSVANVAEAQDAAPPAAAPPQESGPGQPGNSTPLPSEPTHTGLGALWHTTLADFAAFPRRASTWVILASGAAGAAVVHPIDDDLNAKLVGNPPVTRMFAPGKYLGIGWVQVSAGIGTYVVGRYVLPPAQGVSRTNKVAHIGFDLVRAQVLTQAMTYGMKAVGQRNRPTGECCAFPSGHASTTFATAAVLERHLGFRNAWPTLLIAGYVGASRLHDNRHFASDVVFGAALGTAVGWTVVGRHGRSSYAWMPVRVPGGVAVMVIAQPRLPRAENHNPPHSSNESIGW